MIVLSERDETRMKRPIQSVARFGVVFCAASHATGSDRITAKAVAMVAMFTVSHSTRRIAPRFDGSGGIIRPNRSPICDGASQTQAQITSIDEMAQPMASAQAAKTA